MNLIIVESPTKARTLTRFLGKDYSVLATMGHLKDLPKSKLGVEVKKNFTPDYVEVVGKDEAVRDIKKKAKSAKMIYLATDPDREGEAIAFHTKDILIASKGKIPVSRFKRIVFHEITKSAVERAIEDPKELDNHLMDAQIARRVLDRLVGYKLSPLLWRKVRRGLSAGRVQTVAVRLIVEREREIEAFKKDEYWEIDCQVKPKKKDKKEAFLVRLVRINGKKAEVKNTKQAKGIETGLKRSAFTVLKVEQKEVKKSPYPPYTTSTMTQAGARVFHWSARKTMSIAQKLYEEGLITYHRTDSMSIAQSAIEQVRAYIKKSYGEDYLTENPRFYKTRSKVAQEAHEAIRPTKVDREFKIKSRKFKGDIERLYRLIWKRFVACQMANSIYDRTTIDVEAKGKKDQYFLRASGQIMKFDGWRKVLTKTAEEEMVYLPQVKDGDLLDLLKVLPEQKFTQPPPRYNEASLIRTMEKMGIGRPSTYAPTISTIQNRNYVEKQEKKFFPTPVGIAVNDFLLAGFPEVFDYQFTAEMESGLDEIANGKSKWRGLIKDFYGPFEKKLEKVAEKSKRVKIETEKIGKKCPDCKKGDSVIRIGRFGKFISCSTFPDCKYTAKFQEKIGKKCPDCKKGDIIVKKTRKRRQFYGCSRYPDCKWASWRNPIKKK